MAIDYRHLKSRPFPAVQARYGERDTILYALSLGLGQDPVDQRTLGFVYEGAPDGLRILPSQATVLGFPGFWVREPDSGIDFTRVLHGEQRITWHSPLPATGTLSATNRVTHVIDKGLAKGAVLVVQRQLTGTAGLLHVTSQQVLFCRGDGGYGELHGGQPSDAPLPPLDPSPGTRPPDEEVVQVIRPEAALLHRLLADPNPLHADPLVARAAGFDRPILHGLATYGMACWAVVQRCAQGDPARLRSLDVRFSAPVYPGETLQTNIWRSAGGTDVHFSSWVVERQQLVLSHGMATIAP